MEYWGARVTPVPSAIAHYLPSRYVEDVQEDFTFTGPPEEGNATIEEINAMIMNQHPEDIALLADRWQNAHDLLASIRQQLLDQGNALYQQHWRDSRARDLFMEKGPGETLAYLDDWIDATLSNQDALRALVLIARGSRERMEEMWENYERDVAAARDLSLGREVVEDLQFWQGWEVSRSMTSGLPIIGRDTGDAKRQEAQQQIDAVHDSYSLDARRLAREVANEYVETFSKVSSGHGALFEPMNVVFNPPHPPWPTLPGAPPVAPPAPPPAAPAVPPAPPPVATPPPVPVPPGAPPVPPGGLPGPGAVPTPPPVPAGGVTAVPPVLPAGPPSGKLGTAPAAPPATGPGGLPSAAARGALPPGAPGVHKGVLKGSGGPVNQPALPPSLPPPGRTLGRKPPVTPPGTQGGKERERRGARGQGGPESPFAGPPPSAAPPVLGNPRQAPDRPTRRDRPPLAGPRSTDPPAAAPPPGAVPPVLNAPTPAPPARRPPAPRRSPASPAPGTPAAEWVGADTARAAAIDPVLGRPTPPGDGPASRLEEVPERLRRRPAERHPETATGSRPGKVPPDLAPRRAVTDEPVAADAPLDEDAFHVETPGGGVLAKQQERTTYRPEPPAALGREPA